MKRSAKRKNKTLPFLTQRNFILFTLFIITLSTNSAYSQEITVQNYTPNKEYTQDLTYQNKDGDFIIFYNKKGIPCYLRYRIDKWDYDNDKIISELRRGTKYKVTWVFLQYKPMKTIDVREEKVIRKSKKTPVGKYLKHLNILQNTILY